MIAHVCSFFERYRSHRGRYRFRFFIVSSSIVLAIASGIISWSHHTPQLSFLVLKAGIAFNFPGAVDTMVDSSRLTSIMAEQLAKQIAPIPQNGDGTPNVSEDARRTHELVIQALRASLPALMKSAKLLPANTHVAAERDTMNQLLPVFLHISPQVWTKWTDAIMINGIALGDCQLVKSRAACELELRGPQGQVTTIALLFERTSFLFWQIKGIAGLEPFFELLRHQV